MEIRIIKEQPSVKSGEVERVNRERGHTLPDHDCWENPVPYVSDGRLGHGFECGTCGAFLQAG